MNKTKTAKTSYTNSDIVVLALYYLGGTLRYVHLEDVALKAAEFSPKTFSWRKYPDLVDKETARIALKRELGAETRRVFGSIRHGWMLTPQGMSWCLRNAPGEIDQLVIDPVHKEVARIKKTDAFAKLAAARIKEITDNDLRALLRVDEYFSQRNRSERLLALANAAVIDSQLQPFLTILKQRGFSQPEVGL